MSEPSRRFRLALSAGLALWFAPAAALAVGEAAGLLPALAEHRLADALKPPGWPHVLGFDAFGRDLLLITLRASSVSACFAAAAVLASLAVGALAGTFMAVAPASLRFAGERALETLLAFPALLIALAWAAVRGPGWGTLSFSLLLGTLPSLTRLVNVRAREILREDYVTAARGLGAGPGRIALRHLLPGVRPLCRVKAPGLFAHALMAEATLSFLGIGVPIGHDSWGSLLAQGKDYLIEAPHLAIGTGLPLVLCVLGLQLLSSNRDWG